MRLTHMFLHGFSGLELPAKVLQTQEGRTSHKLSDFLIIEEQRAWSAAMQPVHSVIFRFLSSCEDTLKSQQCIKVAEKFQISYH